MASSTCIWTAFWANAFISSDSHGLQTFFYERIPSLGMLEHWIIGAFGAIIAFQIGPVIVVCCTMGHIKKRIFPSSHSDFGPFGLTHDIKRDLDTDCGQIRLNGDQRVLAKCRLGDDSC